jgi:hypothetical protein
MRESTKNRVQKVNPEGKFNKKEWIKLSEREIFNQDEITSLIYNDMPLDIVYKKADLKYKRNEHKEE